MFIKYQHIEKFGTEEVENIELGETYVFPKIDGTNASLWMDEGVLYAGSRNRQLSLESDNAGFFAWASEQESIKNYFSENPSHRLFGEWLVPHTISTYRKDAWRKFYVFDVAIEKTESEILHSGDDKLKYLPYSAYQPLCEKFKLDYINPICKLRNGDYEKFINLLANNVFLIEDGKGQGEGIVIKNYDFRNKYNRQTWAKIITSEFKEMHYKTMGAPEMEGGNLIEEQIVEKYCTESLIEKEYSKIALDGWSSKKIPQLLNTVYYSLIKEESWEFVKEFKNPKIDFKRIQFFVFSKVKKIKSELF